jgi:pimeloyl-ACP methyl ester carboxylesterase
MHSLTSKRGTTAPLQTTTRTHGLRFWITRIPLGLLALLMVLAASGASYEAIMAAGDATRYPQPGQLVNVGGYHMHIHCVGQGSPTVILTSGAGGFSAEWSVVQPQLAQTTRVCAVDRAGLGWSEPGPAPRTPARIADELHTLLVNAGEPEPYVLMAHSAGGKHVRLFAQRHPQDTAGIVLIDPRSEYIEDHMTAAEADAERAGQQGFHRMLASMRPVGLIRLTWAALWPSMLPVTAKLPYDVRETIGVLQARPGDIATAQAENTSAAVDNDRLRGAALGDLPLVVLGAGSSVEHTPHWRASLAYQAGLSTNSRLAIIPGSDHSIHWEDPALVVSAVRDVVDAARTSEPLAQ